MGVPGGDPKPQEGTPMDEVKGQQLTSNTSQNARHRQGPGGGIAHGNLRKTTTMEQEYPWKPQKNNHQETETL